MKRFFYTLFISLILVSCLGENQMKSNAEEQAGKMGQALKNRQFDKYLDYMAHFVYSTDEERDEMKKEIIEQFNYLDERNDRIIRVQSAIHSDLLNHEGFYQCVIKQVYSHVNNYSDYGSTTYLLAISNDGENWKFADVTMLNEKIIMQAFPQLSPDLKFNNKVK